MKFVQNGSSRTPTPTNINTNINQKGETMSFEKIIGNKQAKNILTNGIQTKNILHSYIFSGPEGIGKKLFAKEFAKMILCLDEKEKPCNKCKSCIEF